MTRLIIFEGISGSGKTTLFHPVHKLSDYQDLQVHRLTPTHWVMDRLENRRLSDYSDDEDRLQELFDVTVIFTTCDADIAYKRQADKKDMMIENLSLAKDLFEEYFTCHTRFDNVIRLDTGLLSVEECVGTIREEIYSAETTNVERNSQRLPLT